MSSSVARYLPRTLSRSSWLARAGSRESVGLCEKEQAQAHQEVSRSLKEQKHDLAPDGLSNDERLIALICKGDREALASLFRRYARVVRGVAYRVLRDASEADDLLQDIFLLINRKCDMFDPSRGPARFWILQMTYHRALTRRRYLNSRHFYTRVDLDDAEKDLADPTTSGNGFRAVSDGLLGNSGWSAILETLSEDQRETLRLFFAEGYTLGEIAAQLNQTRSNIKHHYFRGLEKLRKQFFDRKLRGNSAV